MAETFDRILVTGGAGFIGSAVVRHLREHRPETEVVVLDALTYAGDARNLEDFAGTPGFSFVHGDIRVADDVAAAMEGCDAVMHLAAESHVDRSIEGAGVFVETNVLGTQMLLDEARRRGVHRFLHVSTDEVYGELPLDDPSALFTEDTPIAASSPYSASKASSDLLALAAHRTHRLPVLVTRCSNNFGPRQMPEKVIPLFVTNLIDGRKVPLYGDGRNVRDWLHVDDHAEALVAVLERGRPGRVYNVGGNNERSNLELTHAILEAMGFGEEMIERVADRPGHDLRYAIDASRIESELGWRPTRSAWPDALEATIRWYREHEDWWRPLKSRLAAAG